MPSFIISQEPGRTGQTDDAVLCSPNSITGHPDRRSDVPVKIERLSEHVLCVDGEAHGILACTGENGRTIYLVNGATSAVRESRAPGRAGESDDAAGTASSLSVVRGLRLAAKPELAIQGLGLLFNWFAEERECLEGCEEERDGTPSTSKRERPRRASAAGYRRSRSDDRASPRRDRRTGKQRTLILRDALADFVAAELAERDGEIATLKKRLADPQQKVEQQAAIDERVNEISARLEEKQERDSRKNADRDFMQTMGMMIGQERQSARTEFKAAIEEAERAFEAKLAAVEERLKAVPGELPVAKIWRAESVTYQVNLCPTKARSIRHPKTLRRALAARIGFASRAPVVTAAMGERRRSAAHTMRTIHTRSSISSRSMARATSRSTMIRTFALAMAGS